MNGVWLCAAAVAVLLYFESRDERRGVAVAKPLASAAFLGAAWQFGALDSPYGRWIFLGLVLCAAGDVLLIPRGRQRTFLAGIGAFLLGHVAYAVAFFGLGTATTTVATATLAMGAGALLALRWLGPHVPADFVVPVRLYVAVISVMVIASLGAFGAGATVLIPLGAVGFAVSDLAVARDRFVSPGFANGAWGLPLYYGSQLVLASTAAGA